MAATNLRNVIKRLSQGSVDSVQSGNALDELSSYLHVSRPIESILKQKIDEIEDEGGGIVLLVGSAGDGKSHLISCMRKQFPDADISYYNDATASSSPHKTAVQTLQEALQDYTDDHILTTSRKLVLAINLGKLNAFVDEPSVKENFSSLVKVAEQVFDDDAIFQIQETPRIKVVLFTNHQIFEVHPEREDTYPVESTFISQILEKIVDFKLSNPFYKAYELDSHTEGSVTDPVWINYKLLCIGSVRTAIEKYIIECIIRFKLIITPREFLDFVYSILCYSNLDAYKEKRDFYEALLPSLLFCGGDNRILKALSKLDPLKSSSTQHDRDLSVLFTSYAIPPQIISSDIISLLPDYLTERTNKFYSNNGHDIERTTKFLFRLKHVLSYHSENEVYKSFLRIFMGLWNKDSQLMNQMFEMVNTAIPRHSGSFTAKKNMIPLNIQGGQYKLFAQLNMSPKDIITFREVDKDNEFLLKYAMQWKCGNEKVTLDVDYQLFDYLSQLCNGRLALSYENDKDIGFSRFVRELEMLCDSESEITILTHSYKEITLSEQLGNILLQ